MGSNIHELPCGTMAQEDYGCIDCRDYPCMLWKVVRGEMRLPGEVGRIHIPAPSKSFARRTYIQLIESLNAGDILIALRKEEK